MKLLCIGCGSTQIGTLRDMKSTRVCGGCGRRWLPCDDRVNSAEAEATRKEPTVIVPCSDDAWLKVQGPFPLTPREWAGMMRVLDSMKVGLVLDGGCDAVASRELTASEMRAIPCDHSRDEHEQRGFKTWICANCHGRFKQPKDQS